MVQAFIDGNSVRRAYSISSSPTRSGYLDITVRQTENPTMSRYLNEIQEGEYLDIRGPYGQFIWDETVSDKIVLLGAGSGITPLKAIMEYILDKGLDTKVKLLYSCGYGDNVIFGDLLQKMVAEINNCEYELSLTREPEESYYGVRKGRITLPYLREQIAGYEDASFYLCGTPGFVKAMVANLEELGIEKSRIKHEKWG